MRNQLIRLAIQYSGQYGAITRALKEHEQPDETIRIQRALTVLDEEYPQSLRDLKYPPYVLFYIGDISLLKSKCLSIVGTREPSYYGIHATEQLVNEVRERYTLVSGMARGIDAIVHRNAERTIGVLGNGLNYDYPACNASLYQYMREKQLLISEYPLDVRPQRYHFPFRNRLIAALSEDTVVMQAGVHSGSLLTASEALKLGRRVHALVYPYDDASGQGCNQLIADGALMLNIEGFGREKQAVDK
ncbi:MAG: DNA-processing protein DprA [Erysipelotrichaceae bacterium]|nr:DNA-processing protein DprA [Erysipelotrichaceae bacterium]